MRERIHAGGGGEIGRQIEGDLRVEDHELGEKTRKKNDAAALSARESDDGTAADFAAGAGGGGDAHATGKIAPIILKIELRELEVGLLDKEPAGLAHVEGAAAAESDNGIAA